MISQYDNALEQKWLPVLEGITDEYSRKVTAVLLENQAKSILAERVDEADTPTTVGHLGTFQKFAFPLIRRVYPNLIANKIVGVQPMQGPVGQVFYLGHNRVYQGATQNIYSKYNLTYRNLVTSALNPNSHDGFASAVLNVSSGGGNVSIGAGTGVSGMLINTSSTYGGQIAAWPNASAGDGRWTVSAGEVLSGGQIPEITLNIEAQPVTAGTRKMRALWTLEASQDLKAYHNLDLESELTSLLSQEMALEIDRELVEELRMLAYNVSAAGGGWEYANLDWANANNLGTFKGLGVAAAPESMVMSSMTFAQGTMPTAVSTGMGTVSKNVFFVNMAKFLTGFAPQHMGHIYSNLLAVINHASQDIYKSTLRGTATFIVCSPLVAAMLESAAKLEGGLKESDGPTNFTGNGISITGKFMGRYDLLVDPMYPDDEILVGYKGPNAMDSGLVYAPYIPMQQIPTVIDPQTFQPRKGIITRYGKAVVTPANRFYRIIRLLNTSASLFPAGALGHNLS